MGAALHLAHAHQAPVKQRRPKRTGGGNGGKFAELAHKIYQDDRADSSARELLLAVAYAATMAELNEERTVWRAVCDAMTIRNWDGLRFQIRRDLPRYELPNRVTDRLDRRCSGPRVRAHPDGPDDFRNQLKVCGAPAHDKVVEKLPGTGWHKRHWFCERHRDHLARVREQVREQNERAPLPVPNAGGLLPSYFESDWLWMYRWALEDQEWEPPVYGMCADDWPAPGKDPLPERPRLRLVLGGGIPD